jgi:outer membrane protein OmpA-like peptidoglycan-associated protein
MTRAREGLASAVACVLVALLGACGGMPRTGRGDRDRDGVPDAADRCPLVQEDIDGDADEDGCPEGSVGDRDADGLDDPHDACPDDAEDEDGFDDQDGCPDPDDDRDRVADRDDLCRCEPEDHDGFEDADGCPDPDDDLDRIVDACDRCPREAEVYNTFCDEDGCPDRSGVCVDTSRLVIQDRVVFRRHRATMENGSEPILDALAATLRGNPQIERVLVRGHAGTGERRSATLGLARAEATRAALIARGVAPDRLAVEGNAPDEESGWESRATELLVTRVDGVERAPVRALPEPTSSTCAPGPCEPVPRCVAPATPDPVCRRHDDRGALGDPSGHRSGQPWAQPWLRA